MSKKKDLFPTKKLTVKRNDRPDTIVIQHDMSREIRKALGIEETKQEKKPADVIPLVRDRQ